MMMPQMSEGEERSQLENARLKKFTAVATKKDHLEILIAVPKRKKLPAIGKTSLLAKVLRKIQKN